MNRDDVMRMAQEAGLNTWVVVPEDRVKQLEHFASLIAAAEREECAKFLERGVDMAGLAGAPEWAAYTTHLLLGCTEAIRARGKT